MLGEQLESIKMTNDAIKSLLQYFQRHLSQEFFKESVVTQESVNPTSSYENMIKTHKMDNNILIRIKTF